MSAVEIDPNTVLNNWVNLLVDSVLSCHPICCEDEPCSSCRFKSFISAYGPKHQTTGDSHLINTVKGMLRSHLLGLEEMPIQALRLPTYLTNILQDRGVWSVPELLRRGADDIKQEEGIGGVSISHIRKKFSGLGIQW